MAFRVIGICGHLSACRKHSPKFIKISLPSSSGSEYTKKKSGPQYRGVETSIPLPVDTTSRTNKTRSSKRQCQDFKSRFMYLVYRLCIATKHSTEYSKIYNKTIFIIYLHVPANRDHPQGNNPYIFFKVSANECDYGTNYLR